MHIVFLCQNTSRLILLHKEVTNNYDGHGVNGHLIWDRVAVKIDQWQWHWKRNMWD